MLQKIHKTGLWMLVCASIVSACSIFLEADITDEEVILLAPVNNLTTSNYTQTFWWDYVPEATRYNLQIVSPAWDSIISIEHDTNLSQNRFVAILAPGEYEWGVSAYNNSSATAYNYWHITIDSSTALGDQEVVLQYPADNGAINETTILFQWYPVQGAGNYRFTIRKESWQGDKALPDEYPEVENLKIILDEGTYVWGVRAESDLEYTQYKYTSLIVDTTDPGIPVITTPKNYADTIGGEDPKLSWNRNYTSLASISDSLIIASDSLFAAEDVVVKTLVNGTDYTLVGREPGFYFCKLRSVDAAGNIGKPSDVKKFYLSEE